MKIEVQHPQPSAREAAGPRYWRSLDELAATPAFQEWMDKEFPSGATVMESGDRRNFIKIMAASFGLAGLGMAGCRQQTRHLLPYSKQPDRIIPGVPVFYSTSLPGADESIPLIAETNDGRPTKIEGNPSYHPYGGSTSVHTQSSILDLYDPDRAQYSSTTGGVKISPAQVMDVLRRVGSNYAANGGDGLYFLADRSTSPVRAALVQKLQARFPKAVWAEYEALDQANPERAASALAGSAVRPLYHFEKATRVLALESDFLHSEPGHLGYARGFANARRLNNGTEADAEKMVRLYAVESNFSLTGANADHRLRLPTSQIWSVAALLAAEILSQTGASASAVSALRALGTAANENSKWIVECAKDLVAHRGKAAIVAGAQLPVELHQLVLLLNSALGAFGSTITLAQLPARPAAASIADVAKAIDAGAVKTLFIWNGNPAYNAPGDLDFGGKLAKLKSAKNEVIRYGYHGAHADETSQHADTFIAALHYLETWGDGLTWDGVHVPVQPMIQPLFDGFGELDVLSILAGDSSTDAYTFVRNTFTDRNPGKSFDEWLAKGIVGDGFAASSAAISLSSLDSVVASAPKSVPTVNEDHLDVRFVPGITGDGRHANNGWLQECPDPMSKITWDNAILISPALARKLQLPMPGTVLSDFNQGRKQLNTFEVGRQMAPVAEISVNGKKLKGPVSIMPGLASWSVVVTLGYGRKVAGNVGRGVGFDAFPATKFNGTITCSAVADSFRILEGETYQLANVQEHWSMEGRGIIREASVDDYKAHPEFVKDMDVEAHSPPIYGKDKDISLQDKVTEQPRGSSLYPAPPSDKPMPNVPVWNTPEGQKDFPTPQQWGMSIDLNTCLGCTACLVACQAENNIPIVGKDQVLRGREMHWIRLDRYFSSGPQDGKWTATNELPDDPQVTFQSLACQHCENAPCENVCPFAATVHDDSGLNTMVYNRCAGTKFCANNCPYKVRRFNFFDWNKREIGQFYKGPLGDNYYDSAASQLTQMQKNPDVTVRMRGVMEKCTYCVQRIESAKINARVKAQNSGNYKVADGTITPACAQACPTDSIVFGDVSDPDSAVSKAKALDRNYAVMGYLNVRPRTTYLAKIRNQNPAMPDYKPEPLSRLEYEARYGHKAPAGEAKPAGADKS